MFSTSGRLRLRRSLPWVAAFGLLAIPVFPAGVSADAVVPTLASCLANRTIVRVAGTYNTQYKSASPAAGTTLDARGAVFNAYSTGTRWPFSIGHKTAPPRLCVLGGLVRGMQRRDLTWQNMKDNYDGDGLLVFGHNWYVVDGLRVDNVEDGVAPRGTDGMYPGDGDGFVMRNLYFTYIRDDCVENDEIAGGLIEDSLFDGCNTGVSERPGGSSPQSQFPAPPEETLTLDRVLLRLEAMPGPRDETNPAGDPNVLGHGHLFKWSDVSNKLVIKDSIFLIETTPNTGASVSDGTFPFPAGTVTDRVTIVWLGAEEWHWPVPEGTTVVTERSVWDRARMNWLARHGCLSFTSCARLSNPDVFPRRACPRPVCPIPTGRKPWGTGGRPRH